MQDTENPKGVFWADAPALVQDLMLVSRAMTEAEITLFKKAYPKIKTEFYEEVCRYTHPLEIDHETELWVSSHHEWISGMRIARANFLLIPGYGAQSFVLVVPKDVMVKMPYGLGHCHVIHL